MQRQIIISAEDFDVGALYAQVCARHAGKIGGVAIFSGLVRERNAKAGSGAPVQSLTLEHYPGMTEASIDAIVDQAEQRWPIDELLVVHRVGTLAPGEQIVLVICASAHRDAAFAAAEFVMDYLKTDAVFWKKEQASEGEHWVQSTDADRQRAQTWREKENQPERNR